MEGNNSGIESRRGGRFKVCLDKYGAVRRFFADAATTAESAYALKPELKRTVRRKPFRPRGMSATAMWPSERAVPDRCLRPIPFISSRKTDADERLAVIFLDGELLIDRDAQLLRRGVEIATQDSEPRGMVEERHGGRARERSTTTLCADSNLTASRRLALAAANAQPRRSPHSHRCGRSLEEKLNRRMPA
jgi:hypothetical protein